MVALISSLIGYFPIFPESFKAIRSFHVSKAPPFSLFHRYNFCSGTLQETRALCHEMEKQVVRPCLARAGRDTEHLGMALVGGVSSLLPWFSYPAMVQFLGDTMKLRLPSVRTRMTLKHRCQYYFLRFLLHGLFLVPGVVRVFNEVLKLSLSYVQGQHARWKPRVRVLPFTYT